MNDDDLTGRLRGGPSVPPVREDAISLIMAGADARRRRRGRAAILASVAAVALTIAVIAGGSVLISGGERPVPGPVAPHTTVSPTPRTTVSPTSSPVSHTSSPRTDDLTIGAVKSPSPDSSRAVRPVPSTMVTSTPGGVGGPKRVGAVTDTGTPGQHGSSSNTSPSKASSTGSSASTLSSTPTAPTTSLTGTGIEHLDRFRLPSGNIGCVMTTGDSGPAIRCAIAESTAKVCGPGWNHEFVLDAMQATSCRTGPVVAVPEGPILKYGQANVVGGIVCTSNAQAGLHCSSALYGTAFSVSRAAMTTQPSEGGESTADLAGARGNPPVVTLGSGGPVVFGSVDLAVVCKAQIFVVVSIYCARPSAPVGGACTDSGKMAQIVAAAQGTAVTSFCGLTLPGLDNPAVSALQGKIPLGTEFVLGAVTCTAHQDWVSCLGGAEGFSMSAVTGYGPLPAG